MFKLTKSEIKEIEAISFYIQIKRKIIEKIILVPFEIYKNIFKGKRIRTLIEILIVKDLKQKYPRFKFKYSKHTTPELIIKKLDLKKIWKVGFGGKNKP